MPKQNFEISTFTNGIISNPSDELDIPVDAATYSLNVDPQTEGSLGGISDDAFLKESGFTEDMSEISYSQGGSVAQATGVLGDQGQYGGNGSQ
jgi:hypothetical protein